MSVNNVNNSGHTVLYTGGAALAGGAAGAVAGWKMKPFMKDGVPSDRFAKEITDSIHNADKATKPYKSLLDSLYTTAGKVKKAKTVEEMLKAQFETTEKVFDYYKNDFAKMQTEAATAGTAANHVLTQYGTGDFNNFLANAKDFNDFKTTYSEAMKKNAEILGTDIVLTDAATKVRGLDKVEQGKAVWKKAFDTENKKFTEGILSKERMGAVKKAYERMNRSSAGLYAAIGAASAGLLTLVICQLTGKSADRV